MKIEFLHWLEKIEKFVIENPDCMNNFIPFVSEPEAAQFRKFLSEEDLEEILTLAVAAKSNQSVLQAIWCSSHSKYAYKNLALKFGVDSPEFKACIEMERSNPMIDKYEDFYDQWITVLLKTLVKKE